MFLHQNDNFALFVKFGLKTGIQFYYILQQLSYVPTSKIHHDSHTCLIIELLYLHSDENKPVIFQ